MGYLFDRFFDWMTYEPAVGLLMIVATVVLFRVAYVARQDAGTAASWVRRIVEAGAVAALFLGLLWAVRAVLNNNTATFAQSHGRVSETNYQSLMTIWGGPHVQEELEVQHSRKVVTREEQWREDPLAPPVFRNTESIEYVDQNSIRAAHGTAELTLDQRKKGSAYYNGFVAQFAMTYTVANASSFATDAHFSLPLSGQVLYDQLVVEEDGKDIQADLHYDGSGLSWDRRMEPGETHEVAVRYRTRGVESFYYQVPSPREIDDFAFTMAVHGLSLADVNYPAGCLTPTTLEADSNGDGVVLTWHLDQALTAAGMGIALPKPVQPGAAVSAVLHESPYALMMMVVTVSLTLLVRGDRVNLVDLALLSAVYCAQFLIMAGLGDLPLGIWGPLLVGSLLAVGLSAILFRRHRARWLILGLVAFFSGAYPLSGLLPDLQDQIDALVFVALIVYLFFVSLAARVQADEAPAMPAPATSPQ